MSENRTTATGEQPPPASVAKGTPPRLPAKRRALLIVAGVIMAAGFYYGLAYLVEAFTHESTDDAFLDADIVSVAPRVAGQVLAVHVVDNQAVKQGDLLVEVDAQNYSVKVDQKRASVQTSEANLKAAVTSIDLLEAKVTTAEATARQSQADADADAATADRARISFKRNEELRKQGTISPQEFDDAQAALKQTEANFKAAEQKAAADESKVKEAKGQLEVAWAMIDTANAQTKQAQTDVEMARLDLSYAKISAPCAGKVTRKAVEPGDYVQVGQSLMALVKTDLWVTANFKETQLTAMRTNQPAEIRIDAHSAMTFRGHVDSVMAGSGARFSLLPPENAVGNFVKVVQRVPVKIVFDGLPDSGLALGPGMSVVPEVRTSDFSAWPGVIWLAAVALAALGTMGLRRIISHLQD